MKAKIRTTTGPLPALIMRRPSARNRPFYTTDGSEHAGLVVVTGAGRVLALKRWSAAVRRPFALQYPAAGPARRSSRGMMDISRMGSSRLGKVQVPLPGIGQVCLTRWERTLGG